MKGYSETIVSGGYALSLKAGRTVLSLQDGTDVVKINAKELATTDSASNTRTGLMSIDHYKSVEDMITNFKDLVNSQTEVKNAIADLTKRVGYGDEAWESYLSLTTNKTKEANARLERAVSFILGADRISKIVGENESFVIKGDSAIHTAPIDVDTSRENTVQMYNNGATEVVLDRPYGTDRLKRLLISSPKITRITGYWTYIDELDVLRCPNLNHIILSGNEVTTFDLRHNRQMQVLSLAESIALTTLDLTNNTLVSAITLNLAKKLTTLNISGCKVLNSLSIIGCQALKLSGITFPSNFRPTTMNIKGTGFTYEDVVALAGKYSLGSGTNATLFLDESMYMQLVITADEVEFSDKYVQLIYTA